MNEHRGTVQLERYSYHSQVVSLEPSPQAHNSTGMSRSLEAHHHSVIIGTLTMVLDPSMHRPSWKNTQYWY